MANVHGHTNGRVIGQMVLANLVALPVLSQISVNWGGVQAGQQVKFNQQVSVPLITAVAAASYNRAAGGYAATDSADTNATVTIDKHKHVTREITVAEGFSYDEGVLARYAELDANTLANEMIGDLLALVVNPAVPTASQRSIVAVGSFNHGAIVDISTALDIRDVTEVGRFGILNASYHGALRKDSTIISNAINPESGSVNSGLITTVDGVQFSKYRQFPANGENLTGCIGTPDAFAIATILPDLAYLSDAMGLPMDAAVSVVTEPKSGLSLLVVEKIDSTLGTITRSFRLMYGVGLGNTLNIQKIASA